MVKTGCNLVTSIVDRSFSQSAIGASLEGDMLNQGPLTSNRILVLQGMQKSNMGDERISLGSLDEVEKMIDDDMAISDEVGEENKGSQRRFELQ